MEALNVLGFLGAWILLGVLANRYGYDSRDGFYDPPTASLWQFANDEGPNRPKRGRRSWAVRATQAAQMRIVREPGTRPSLARVAHLGAADRPA